MSSTPRPLSEMRLAMEQGRWEEAWSHADDVLARYGDDADAIGSVARVAQQVQQPQQVAELLTMACKVESFKNITRIQQAMVAQVAIGHLFEAIKMLEEAVAAQPNQHQARRWLYDLYVSVEDRGAAQVHGRTLVLQRHFDVDLLTSLSDVELKKKDPAPLNSIVEKYPADNRPLLDEAKTKFDELQIDDALIILRRILSQHPNYLPAQVLFAQSLAAEGEVEELAEWVRTTHGEEAEQVADYWLVVGELAVLRADHLAAARAFSQATKLDPDSIDAWSRLEQELIEINRVSSPPIRYEILPLRQRIEALKQVKELEARFLRTGKISRATALDIVHSLEGLGRLWEAEAWASIGVTLPEDERVPLEPTRRRIINQLQRDTPWQSTSVVPHVDVM